MTPLERLQKRLSNLSLQRQGFAVCIVGETGMGKTHTLNMLRQNLPHTSQTVPASVSVQALLAQLPRPERLPAWLEKNLERQDVSLPTVLGLLEELAPFTLFVEDLHRQANPLWQELLHTIAQCPKVALVGSSRETVPDCENILLEPLTLEASAKLLERELGANVPQVASAWIFQKAAGNPFFSLEYLRFLARMGFLWNDGTRWHWREPPTDSMPVQIEALLEEQLFSAQLSAEQMQLLLAMAYLETRLTDFAPSVLASVLQSSHQDFITQSTTLIGLGLIGQDAKISHTPMREVLFRKGQRQHPNFAKNALEALQDHPKQAALVLPEAGLTPSQQAEFWLALAEKTQEQPLLSAQYRLNAAEHLKGQEKIDLMLQAILVLGPSEPHKEIQVAKMVLALPELQSHEKNKATYFLCHGIATTSRNLEAVREALAQLDELEQQSAQYVWNLLGYLMICGQPSAALELWDKHPEHHAIADSVVRVHLLSARLMTGQFETVLRESLVLLEAQIDDRQRMGLLNLRAVALAQTGQLDLSEKTQLEAIEVAKKTGQHNAVGTLLFNRALTLDRRGDSAMRQCAEDAIAALTRAGNLAQATQAHLLVSNHDLEHGNYAEAQERLDHAYASLKYTPPSPFLVTLLLTMAHHHRERRLPYGRTLAQTFSREGLVVAQKIGQSRLVAAAQAQLVWSAVTPDLELAKSAWQVLKDLAEPGSIFGFAALAHALETHQPDQAKNAWADALARAEELNFVFDAQLYRLEMARLSQDKTAAQELHQWFTERGLLHGANVTLLYFPDLEKATVRTTQDLVVLNSIKVGTNPVKGAKRQELLLHLLETRLLGKGELQTFDLLDKLYPNQADQEAQIALRQLVFKTRAAHGTNIILTTQNGYALGEVSSDLERFLQNPEFGLWRTAYPSFGSTQVRESLHQTALRQAQNLLETNPSDVAQAMHLLLETDPYDLTAIRLTCLALQNSNNPKTVNRFYSTQKEKFFEVGEELPENWSMFVKSLNNQK